MNPKFRMKAVASLILPALVLGLASTTYANDAATKTGAQMKGGDAAKVANYRPASMSARELRATKLIGTDVKNAQGESLGEIQDLVSTLPMAASTTRCSRSVGSWAWATSSLPFRSLRSARPPTATS